MTRRKRPNELDRTPSDRLPPLVAVLLFILFSFLTTPSTAQDQKFAQTLVTVTLKNASFPEALSVIESKCPYKFAYDAGILPAQHRVSLTAVQMPLQELLRQVLVGTTLTYQVVGDQIILQSPHAASTVTLSGYVKDTRTGELLIGASIYEPFSGHGILSNNYGFYSLSVPVSDTLNLEISYVGYKTLSRRVNLSGDEMLSFELEHNDDQESIGKLTISKDKREDNVKKNQTALVDLSNDMIVSAPSVSGSGDVISSVEMLPGVQAGIDGSPGYYVRGGNEGQNLILLDDATLYNPSHIFGLVGIFNPPTVKYASLMKGGFPAIYGDHISSVLNVVMKDGSNQQTGGNVQMGTLSSGATVYGPLEKGKSSYLISGRRSMTDVLLHPLLQNNYFKDYYFYDVNAKLSFQLSPKDRLLVGFYSGRDNNTYSGNSTDSTGIDYSMNFGNTTFMLRWNHQFSGKLFSHTSVEYNRYHQFLSATEDGFFAQLYSGIKDINAKSEIDWYPASGHTITAGVDYLHQALYPASLSGQVAPPDSTLNIVPSGIPPKTNNRVAAYVGDNIVLGKKWQAYVGVRAPYFFKDDATYFSVEPRLSLLYLIDPTTSVKVSFTSMHQYIHLVQSYNASFPAEIWIGSSNVVQPQTSTEYTAGVYKNFLSNILQTSLEVYYKQMGNQLLFGGVDTPVIDNSVESQLVFGKAWSYGAELFVRKNRGRWTGWLAYTLAYAYQQFDSLNEGQTFPFAYDRRNMVDLSTAYAITPHWKIAANFLAASGRAFSLSPDSSYIINPGPGHSPLFDNPGRGRGQGRGLNRGKTTLDIIANNYRLTPYNRLDLSLHYQRSRTIGRRTLLSEWIFSVYNVYARPNNSFVYRTIDPSTRKVIAKQLPLIPVIPSITYELTF
jgi:hypothetical protein